LGCIVPQTLQRGRETVVGGADPAAVPVADEVPPEQGLQLLRALKNCVKENKRHPFSQESEQERNLIERM
jgi:hypothetical protein